MDKATDSLVGACPSDRCDFAASMAPGMRQKGRAARDPRPRPLSRRSASFLFCLATGPRLIRAPSPRRSFVLSHVIAAEQAVDGDAPLELRAAGRPRRGRWHDLESPAPALVLRRRPGWPEGEPLVGHGAMTSTSIWTHFPSLHQRHFDCTVPCGPC